MFAVVVVFSYQAPDVGYFTYKIPKELEDKIKSGQVVKVPFGKRNPLAIVVSTRRDLVAKQGLSLSEIKPIDSIIRQEILLLPIQLKILNWLSKYYLAPTVNCLEAMLPFGESELAKLLENQAITQIEKQTSDQTLVLVPSQNRLPETTANYKPENYVIFNSFQKPKEKFEVWKKLLTENVDFIFGTRSAVFLPFRNLKKIIIFDEHDSVYKDQRSPYHDTLTVAQKLENLTGCNLQIIDSSPRLSTYSSLKNQIVKPKDAPMRTKIISMIEEKNSGRTSPISQLLEELIERNHNQQGSTLLFLNKKKESGTLWCGNCRTNNYLQKEVKTCPSCSSKEVFFFTLNTKSLKSEILKFTPNAKIRIIAEGEKYNFSPNPDIDIATSYIFYTQNLSKYNVVAHVLVDKTLGQP